MNPCLQTRRPRPSVAEELRLLRARARALATDLGRLIRRCDAGHPLATNPKCARILTLVANHFGLDERAVRSKSRLAELVWARHLAIRACVEFATPNRSAVARAFKLDHGTVLNALRAVQDRIDSSPPDRQVVEELRARLTREFPSPPTFPDRIGISL